VSLTSLSNLPTSVVLLQQASLLSQTVLCYKYCNRQLYHSKALGPYCSMRL
jgi:hypothetical protein